VVRSYLQAAHERGDLRKEVDPADVANLVVTAFAGIQLSSQVISGRSDLHQRVTNFWKFLLPGLVPPRRLARFIPSGSMGLDSSSATA
jgi:hypothetical protein